MSLLTNSPGKPAASILAASPDGLASARSRFAARPYSCQRSPIRNRTMRGATHEVAQQTGIPHRVVVQMVPALRVSECGIGFVS